jgi:hypothetical protein
MKVGLQFTRNVLRCTNSRCKANFWNRDVNAARNIHPRTARYQTDGSREDCCLCSRVKRVSMQRGWEGFRSVTTPPGNFDRSKSPRQPPPDDFQVGGETLHADGFSPRCSLQKHAVRQSFEKAGAAFKDTQMQRLVTISSTCAHVVNSVCWRLSTSRTQTAACDAHDKSATSFRDFEPVRWLSQTHPAHAMRPDVAPYARSFSRHVARRFILDLSKP